MADAWDEFFIQKIKEGLSARSLSLSADEEELLRTPASSMPEDFADRAKELLPKAIGALTEAYARDTAGRNRDQMLRWRQHISAMYEHSQLFVTAVMQEWYLSCGRAQEKGVSGCLPSLIFLAVFAVVFVLGLVELYQCLG